MSSYLTERLDALRVSQNPDGGWSFYQGKRSSWLEPTVLAALALHGEPAAERAWNLVAGWQNPSGGWRPTDKVPGANWTSALALLLAASQQRDARIIAKGIEWLRNAREDGAWTWRSDNPVGAEPTALALVALAASKRLATKLELEDAGKLASSGLDFLKETTLRPETCGPVLVGLQAAAPAEARQKAEAWRADTHSPWIRAWLTLGLRLSGADPDDGGRPLSPSPASRNLAVVAWEALAARGGNFELFRREAA